MRSPRNRFESACRIGVFALLGWLLGGSIIRTHARRVESIANDADLAQHLAAITRESGRPTVHLNAALAPDAWAVDWLAALAHSGASVTWTGKPPAVAMSAEAMVDPAQRVRINVAAPAGAIARVRDEASDIDSVKVKEFGAAIVAPRVIGNVSAVVSGQQVTTAAVQSAAAHRVLVVGSADWEEKFIVSALEEAGWQVDARFAVAPGVNVLQGDTAALDTSRFAAAVIVDSSANTIASALERFVRSGGGAILAGSAPLTRTLSALAAGTSGARTHPATQAAQAVDTARLGSTGFYPVAQLRPGALVLERRARGISIAARRLRAGRVLQIGYDDSWRWRMAGAPGSERAHREWWSRAVSSVAYIPSPAPPVAKVASSAPLAYLIDRLGPPRAAPPGRGGGTDPRLIAALMMILLLAEWTSRRLRGVR